MARKTGSTISQEELYPPSDESTPQELDDPRVLDLDAEQESPFLRGQKRVSVRRGSLPKKTATRLTWIAASLTVILISSLSIAALYRYGEHSWRFRVQSSDDIEIAGLENVSKSQVMEVMGGDIGRNIFFIPLSQRKTELERISWVESASVMRFVPNRLRVEIHERNPVAFARVGSKILLVDAAGSLMDLPTAGKNKHSFPVILGMNLGEPLSTRSARMKIYNQLVGELDSDGAHYSQELNEVDLSDPDDVKVTANSPHGEVLVHLGSSNYLYRYKKYVTHVQEWRQQFDKLDSVDLRYDRQIIVNPDLRGTVKPEPLSVVAAKAAVAAGVKPASLVTREAAPLKAAATKTKPAKPPVKQAVARNHSKTSHKRTASVKLARPRPVWHNAADVVKTSKPKDSTPVPKTTTSIAAPSAVPSNAAVPKPANASKPKKPSPAIAKDQGHP